MLKHFTSELKGSPFATTFLDYGQMMKENGQVPINFKEEQIKDIINQGVRLVQAGRIEEGKVLILKGIDMGPQMSAGYLAFGSVCFDEKKFDEALKYLRKSYKIQPKNYFVLYLLGTTLFQTKHFH